MHWHCFMSPFEGELEDLQLQDLNQPHVQLSQLCCMSTLVGAGSRCGVRNSLRNPPRDSAAGCPFCKKVRETVSALALDVIVYPTPRVTLKAYGVLEGSRYRPAVMEAG